MNQDVKRAWLEALRSGEYQQGHQRLRYGDRFCCLGVLCDLHAKATGNIWDEYDRYFAEIGTPPRIVVDWAELSDTNPYMPRPPGVMGNFTIAEYNDGKRDVEVHPHTFAEIADLIEAHL